MFCCTKSEAHAGQIVTSVCKNKQCIQFSNELCCVKCVIQKHKQHKLVSLKEHLQHLLKAEREKLHLIQRLKKLILQFFPDTYSPHQTLEENFRKTLMIASETLQRKNQQNLKIRQALRGVQQIQENSKISHLQNSIAISNLKYSTNSDGLSQTAKHPHLSLSNNNRVLIKTTNYRKNHHYQAQRVCALSSFTFSTQQQTCLVRIDKSQGNIMIGFCHQQIIRDKQFINCYGMNSGSYLIGQNSKATTAICFHHNDPIFNRKQIVGWNFGQGDKIQLSTNMKDGYLIFRNKSQDRQFNMGLPGLSQMKVPLKLAILLQNINDQVTLLQP